MAGFGGICRRWYSSRSGLSVPKLTGKRSLRAITLKNTVSKSRSNASPSSSSRPSYEEIHVETLQVGAVLPFRLFTRIEGEYIVYRREDTSFSETQRQALVENNLHVLYVSDDQLELYWEHLRDNIRNIIENTAIPEPKRALVFYQSIQKLAERVYGTPFTEESLQTTQSLVENNLLFMKDGKSGLHLLMRNMQEQPHLYSHGVHVSQYGLALARELGINDPQELEELGAGLFLQDIGMLKLPQHLIHKAGPLSFDEWAQVKRHPAMGVELLEKAVDLPAATRSVVYSHHERLDGSGYPEGLSGKELSTIVRLSAVVDAFASLTSSRPFRDPTVTYNALSTMATDLGVLYDREIFMTFVSLLGTDNIR